MASNSAMASTSTQSIITLVFGVTATAVSAVTVWQGRKLWRLWHDRHRTQKIEEDTTSSLELGLIHDRQAYEANDDSAADTRPVSASSAQIFELACSPKSKTAPAESSISEVDPSLSESTMMETTIIGSPLGEVPSHSA